MEGCWVFGGVERVPTEVTIKGETVTKNKAGEMFSVIVKDRTEATLLPLIKKHIAPGSIVISDKWKAYDKIGKLQQSFTHLSVNHSKEFKDKTTGACTNTIEGAWRSQLKSKIHVRNYSRFCLGEYINKRMWVKKHSDNLWMAVWKLLSKTQYDKIVYIRSCHGGSWKKKHEEEEKIRVQEMALKQERKLEKKERSEVKKRAKEERKRKREEEMLAARKQNRCLSFFLDG